MAIRILVRAAALALGALALAAGSASAALRFSAPAQLPHGDPHGTPYLAGGEPSLAFDPAGDGHVYVTAPQGIPAAAGGALGGNSQGVAYWASDDHGLTWPRSGLTGTGEGGGDSDVEVLRDHSVLVADLEAAAADICISHDFAHSFPDCANGVTTNQEGPENDREWLTRGTRPGEVYLTYHDFTAGFPIIERSTDGGRDFTPCGTIIDPQGPAAKTYTPSGGTLVSKPVIDGAGTIYVEFTTPDQTASPVGAALNHLYMAVAKGGCTGSTVFKNYAIYTNPGADLAKIFQAQAIDGGGGLYVLTGGRTAAGQSNTGLWMFASGDGGRTWSKPLRVNPPQLKANVFPTIAGGPARGEVAFGWFGTTTSGDPNTQTNQWRFYAGESFDGGRSVAYATVTPSPLHYGDICTQGVFCGLIPGQPGNRNLADFASVAVDPHSGCPALAMPGDPYNRPDKPGGANTFGSSAYFAREIDATGCLTRANAGRAASGGAVLRPGASPIQPCAPRARVTRARVSGRRLALRGRAGAGAGCALRRVQVSLGRRVGHGRCRFVGAGARARSCSRARWVNAHGRRRWRLTVRHLARGRYVLRARAVARDGTSSHPRARRVRVR